MFSGLKEKEIISFCSFSLNPEQPPPKDQKHDFWENITLYLAD